MDQETEDSYSLSVIIFKTQLDESPNLFLKNVRKFQNTGLVNILADPIRHSLAENKSWLPISEMV